MRRAIRFARRNKLLIAATALLMAGAGCVSAVSETGRQLTKDALKPIAVPARAYRQAVEATSSTKARDKAEMDQSGL